MSKISLSGLNKSEVLEVLINGASGLLRTEVEKAPYRKCDLVYRMTPEQAQACLAEQRDVVKTFCFPTHSGLNKNLDLDLSQAEFDPKGYDEIKGEGSAKLLIDKLRETSGVNQVTISPGQAILLLISSAEGELKETLKQIYLSGPTSSSHIQMLNWSFTLLERDYGCRVSYDFEVINEDPVRRYFETRLAFESIVTNIDSYYQPFNALIVKEGLPIVKPCEDKFISRKKPVAQKPVHSAPNVLQNTKKFDSDCKSKTKEFLDAIHCSAVICAQKLLTVPMDIYSTNTYFSAEIRGRTVRSDEKQAMSDKYGILRAKDFIPEPYRDLITLEEADYKATDQRSCDTSSVWANLTQKKLVHPFVNSISGTLLMHLRWQIYLDRKYSKKNLPDEHFIRYYRLFIAIKIFLVGGHTLHEFISVFDLKEVRLRFKMYPFFNDISIKMLFYDGNQQAFNTALDSAIEINKVILARKRLDTELVGFDKSRLVSPVLRLKSFASSSGTACLGAPAEEAARQCHLLPSPSPD